jgi:uncharacterized protein
MTKSLPFLLLLSGFAVARAQDAPPLAKYVPAQPDRAHVFVMDSAHVLSAAAIAALQDSALALQKETGADVAWVTLPTLGGRAIEEASVYLGRAWKIGSAGAPGDPTRNRGLLVLYIPDKTKTAGSNFRVEVGKGLQGTIIDSRSRSISAAMREDLRAKRYDAAYMKGWTVAAALGREDFASQGTAPAPPPTAVSLEPSRGPGPVVAVLIAFVFIALLIALIRSNRRRGDDPPTMVFLPPDDDDEDSRRRRDTSSSSSWSSGSSDSGSSSSSDGGSFGGGGGFDGGGSSDSI